jgi:tetratricopeptide (TPR) repeat protein
MVLRMMLGPVLAAAVALAGCTDSAKRQDPGASTATAEGGTGGGPTARDLFGWITPARTANQVGIEAYTAGDYRRARAAFMDAVNRSPETAAYSANAGMAEQALGRFDRAILMYRLATGLDPAITNAYLNMAQCYIYEGREDQALEALEAGARANPHSGRALANVAKFYVAKGNLVSAREWLTRAVEADPTDASVRSEYDAVLRQLGQAASPGPETP